MTNLTFTGNPILIRMLSHQLTGQVVWYSIDSPNSKSASRVPICCADLDYVTYVGPAPARHQAAPRGSEVSPEADFWVLFKNYKLVYFQPDAKFDIADLSEEFADHVRLERAMCYATALIHAGAQRAAEKNGVIENPLYDTALDPDHVADLIAKRHLISKADAIKLYAFKLQEYKIMVCNLRYNQIEAEMSIVSAKTVAEVTDACKIAMNSFGRLRFDEKSLTKFL